MTTPYRRPTPRKAKRMYRDLDGSIHDSAIDKNSAPVAVIDVSDEDALIAQAAKAQREACKRYFPLWDPGIEEIMRSMEYVTAALASLGIIKRKHLPAIHAKRGKGRT